MTQLHEGGWTAERVEQLKALWAEGKSCAEIARAMGGGLTRNGVIGKVHRLKLRKRGRMQPRTTPRPIRGDNRARAARVERMKQWAANRSAPPTEPELADFDPGVWAPLPGTAPIGIMELRRGLCHWPVGGTHTSPGDGYCGAPSLSGRRYCETHQHLALRPAGSVVPMPRPATGVPVAQASQKDAA